MLQTTCHERWHGTEGAKPPRLKAAQTTADLPVLKDRHLRGADRCAVSRAEDTRPFARPAKALPQEKELGENPLAQLRHPRPIRRILPKPFRVGRSHCLRGRIPG